MTSVVILSEVRLTQRALDRLHEYHVYYLKGVRGGRKILLRRCDLRGLDFTKMNLTSAKMLACDLSGATLFGAVLKRATLYVTKFNGADLTNANFENANMRACEFEDANLTGTDFIDARLSLSPQPAATHAAPAQRSGCFEARNIAAAPPLE